MARKKIGFILANPEGEYQQRLLAGVFRQCKKYDYDVVVFSAMVPLAHFYHDYLTGELNIYNLINFEKLDGVLFAPVSMTSEEDYSFIRQMVTMLSEKCSKPVALIDMPLKDYPVVETDDRKPFSLIADHLIDTHHCDPDLIYVLAGPEANAISHDRIEGVRDAYNKRGLKLYDSQIFYGNFWFSGGAKFAESICNGEIPKPEAIICGNDFLAIGLINRLTELGVRVPEDIRVTGYDATHEALLNRISVSSYIPDIAFAASEAVDILRKKIDPNLPIEPAKKNGMDGFVMCQSCGCDNDTEYFRQEMRKIVITVQHDYYETNAADHNDMGKLLESYMMENLTATTDVENCLWKIFSENYLLRPYGEFYLCLREEWLDFESDIVDGYPARMKSVLHVKPGNPGVLQEGEYCSNTYAKSFDTALMLPELYDEEGDPKVYYFTPVHFKEITLGYSVLVCSLETPLVNQVYRNWVRYVANALQMARTQNQMKGLMNRDSLTGLYNRRGLADEIEKMLENMGPDDQVLSFVIDMDGLKFINDNFGHAEGDFGIKTVGKAVAGITGATEVCARCGGDEFYIIGIGNYTEDDAKKRVDEFYKNIEESAKTAQKPYDISASIGYACEPYVRTDDLNKLFGKADDRMYQDKVKRKKQRRS